MVHTRAGGKSRLVTIGRHGVWTPKRARREAGSLIASLKAGETPRRPGAHSPSTTGPTIAEVAERYMTEHVAVRCKPTTQRACRHILDEFLLPRFGSLRLSEVTQVQTTTRYAHLARNSVKVAASLSISRSHCQRGHKSMAQSRVSNS